MKIVEPKSEVFFNKSGVEMLKNLEKIGRVCYNSELKVTENSYIQFISNIIARGHLSIIEHESITFYWTCERSIANELVRHRISSFAQQSQRYVKFDDVEVIKPSQIKEGTQEYLIWEQSLKIATDAYKSLIACGTTPQNARSVLPNACATKIYCTMNLRELRHFFELRCDAGAHPDIRVLAKQLLEQVSSHIPIIFDDLKEKFLNNTPTTA
jgi:thymidylate synthase (FAD)